MERFEIDTNGVLTYTYVDEERHIVSPIIGIGYSELLGYQPLIEL